MSNFRFNVEEINKDNISFWLKKGKLFYDIEEYNESMKCYNKAIEIDENCKEAWYGKGLLLQMFDEDDDDVIECYDRAIEIDENYKEAWYEKGNVYFNDSPRDALDCFKHATDIDVDYIEAWNSKGHIYFNLRQYSNALDCYDFVILIDETNTEAWRMKIKTLRAIDNNKELNVCYETLYNMD
jgi:tetratricopeptide (TPR) repeat protein